MFKLSDERAKWKIAARLEKRSLLIAVNLLTGLAIFFFSYDQGMMGGVNDSQAYMEQMGLGYKENSSIIVTNTLLQGGIVSVFYLGTLCTAMNPTWMIVSCLINGIGTGVLNATVPVCGSELAEYESRGMFIAMEFTLNIVGVLVVYWLGFGFSYISNGTSEFQWRFPVAFQIVMLLILVTTCWFFPESPRWLCMMGRREALYILNCLRGSPNENAAIQEMQEIEATVELKRESGQKVTYFHILFGIGSGEWHIARCVQLMIWLQILQSWSGIAGVTIYAPTIFQIAGFDSQKTMWISGLNNIFYAFATLLSGQAIAMFAAGGLARGGMDHPDNQEPWSIGATSMVYLYMFVFGATWLTLPWLYPAEIFPLKVGAKGNAWGVVGWSLGNGIQIIDPGASCHGATPGSIQEPKPLHYQQKTRM
ncbi:hypothetical protein BDW62DRAFT_216792 [Aspergillus aurantiobrunneus]